MTAKADNSRRGCRWSVPCSASSSSPTGSGPVHDYERASASASTGLYTRLFRALLERGVALAPGPYEVAFPSMAHGQAELEHTLDVAAEAVTDVVAG